MDTPFAANEYSGHEKKRGVCQFSGRPRVVYLQTEIDPA